jgi:hypothetical protein
MAHFTRALLTLTACLLVGLVQAKTYSTTFGTTENPISENSAWTKSATAWSAVRTGNGIAYGTHGGVNYDDSYAHLPGFEADQSISGVIYRTGTFEYSQEIELLLRVTDTSSSVSCYEILISKDGNGQIMRWNGSMGDFTQIGSFDPGTPADGDAFKAQIAGSTITVYKNGNKLTTDPTTVSDTTLTSGNPGIGFFTRDQSGGQNPNFGWASITAVDTYCGDGIRNGDEECDGTDFDGWTCQDFGYDGGSLHCVDCLRGFYSCFNLE